MHDENEPYRTLEEEAPRAWSHDDAGAAETPDAPAPPKGIEPLWFLYLFFRPRRFFAYFGARHWVILTIVCTWIFGMAGVIDRIERRGSMGQLPPFFTNSWSVYWACVAIFGAISAVIVYLIGGWWYRMRLIFSGAKKPDKFLARRVYVFAAQVHAIPSLLFAGILPLFYATPADAWTRTPWWTVFLALFPFWSFVVSYVGVRTVFDVGRLRALIWFLLLPSGLTGLVVVVIFLAALLGVLSGPPADVANAKHHVSSTMYFELPGNWRVAPPDPGVDQDYDVSVNMPQDGYVRVQLYPSDMTVQEEVDAAAQMLAASFGPLTPIGDGVRWGSRSGRREMFRFTLQGADYILTIFTTEIDDGEMLEVYEVYPAGDEELVRPGVDLIRSTFRLL